MHLFAFGKRMEMLAYGLLKIKKLNRCFFLHLNYIIANKKKPNKNHFLVGLMACGAWG